MAEQTHQEEALDLAGLSDDEIQTMSPDQLDRYLKAAVAEEIGAGEPIDDESEPDTDQDDSKSATADEDRDNGDEVTGGADSDYQSLDPYGGMADSGRDSQSADEGNEEAASHSAEDDQSSETAGEAESSGDEDWKARYEVLQAEYDSVMGSFKASGRTVKVESPDDARRLMQMGYDYTNKMRELKPRLRAIRALEHNGLLDDEKFNFMIDLMKGNPEAIKKFLKDSEIDPIDLDLEDSTAYKPTDHRPSEEQLALDDVLDSLKETEAFPRTAHVITKEWDKASQQVLMGMPQLIAVINDHMEKGYYDQISAKVQYERSLGRLAGLSDLDAYKAVGDAMQRDGAFVPARRGTTPAAVTGQGPSQDSKGSNDSVKGRKRAASPTKGGAGTGKAPSKNFLNDFTDEEIEKMGSGAL
jgi:hypothetical protein